MPQNPATLLQTWTADKEAVLKDRQQVEAVLDEALRQMETLTLLAACIGQVSPLLVNQVKNINAQIEAATQSIITHFEEMLSLMKAGAEDGGGSQMDSLTDHTHRAIVSLQYQDILRQELEQVSAVLMQMAEWAQNPGAAQSAELRAVLDAIQKGAPLSTFGESHISSMHSTSLIDLLRSGKRSPENSDSSITLF